MIFVVFLPETRLNVDLPYKVNLFESFSRLWLSFIARSDYEVLNVSSLVGVWWSLGPGSVNDCYTGMIISKEWSRLTHSPGPDSSD